MFSWFDALVQVHVKTFIPFIFGLFAVQFAVNINFNSSVNSREIEAQIIVAEFFINSKINCIPCSTAVFGIRFLFGPEIVNANFAP